MDIDLQIYYCKSYDKDIEVKHTYFLIIPGQKDTSTFRINFDQTAEPNEETVKHWINQPWYHHDTWKISYDSTYKKSACIKDKSLQKIVDKVGKERWKHPLSPINALQSWRGVTKKTTKELKNSSKKLKDDYSNLKKHYEEENQ